jgi:hypothetical protein
MNNDPRSMWPDFEKLRAELAKNLGLPADFVPGPRQPGKIEAKSGVSPGRTKQRAVLHREKMFKLVEHRRVIL